MPIGVPQSTQVSHSRKHGIGARGSAIFRRRNGATEGTDGSSLVVVWRNPSTLGTAIVMDGELALAGDTTRLDFAAPCAGGNMIMSLASSFSFNSGKDPTGQVTNVDVITSSTSARRLTSCAGGNDDGAFLQIDGALITVGGIGDNPANPAPNCTRGADDDELYNLALGNSADANPFLKNGDTFVQFETNNPSFNDNVYLLAFTTGFQVSRVDGSPTLPGLTVPEPESLGLVSLGLLGVAWVRRRAWSIRRTRWTA